MNKSQLESLKVLIYGGFLFIYGTCANPAAPMVATLGAIAMAVGLFWNPKS